MKNYTIFLLALVIFAACTKEADIKLPEPEVKLVVTSFISPEDTVISAVIRSSRPKYVSYSGPELESDVVTDAVVSISGPGGSVTLPFDEFTNAYLITASAFPITAGSTYSIYASTADGKSVWAQTTVPANTLAITSFSGQSTRRDVYSADYEFWFEAADIPGETNYVALYHRQNRQDQDSLFGWIDYGRGTFYNDENQPRKSYYERVTGSTYQQDSVQELKIDIEALNCSRDFYLYNNSVQEAAMNNFNPFADPVMVYSNINNGFGCFGAFRRTANSIIIQ